MDLVGSKLRILLVDDEPLLTKVTAKMLERLGCQPVAITSSQAALELYRESPDDFDALITDLNMPDMSGDQLAREIREINPAIPILIASGKVRSQGYADGNGPEWYVLSKPYALQDLKRAITQLTAK